MKNILFVSVVAFVFCLGSCNYNDKNFEGLEDMVKPTNPGPFALTYVGAPFTAEKPAKDKIEDWLFTQIFTADSGAIAAVTYDFKTGTPAQVVQQVDEYMFKGYTEKWVFVRTVPRFLIDESFDDAGGNGKVTSIQNWLNTPVQGTYTWTTKSYSGNFYSQFSANKAPGVCEGWLITPKLLIKDGMVLSFDVCVGYYNAECLQVMISSDFDGTEDGIASATWTDVSSDFTLPQEPTTTYGTLAPAGTLKLTEFKNQNVYVGFKYLGDGKNKKTTTYQLDNIFVGYK